MRTRGLLWPARRAAWIFLPIRVPTVKTRVARNQNSRPFASRITRRHLPDVAAAQQHAVTGRGRFERQLRAGVSRADDEHVARGKLRGVLVRVRVDLDDRPRRGLPAHAGTRAFWYGPVVTTT